MKYKINMKYINKFSTNTDYQTFKGSSYWVTPNISYIEEEKKCKYNVKKLAFTLSRGHNGDNGVYIFNLLFNKYGLNYEGTIAETIMITGTDYEDGTYNTITIENTDDGRIYFGETHAYLRPDGFLYSLSHGGGSN
jgi:hypothetical protein